MAKVKCSILAVEPDTLERSVDRLLGSLDSPAYSDSLRYIDHLPSEDQEYLCRWFSPQALRQLDFAMICIQRFRDPAVKDLFRLVLSNILRKVSWQKEDDLRVRKEINVEQLDALEELSNELSRSTPPLLEFLRQERERGWNHGTYRIEEGDARRVDDRWRRLKGRIDVVITSPPYATALPYIDTDRLSLVFLGLLSRRGHRQLEQCMIGNREISNGFRESCWGDFQKQKAQLPRVLTRLVERIERLNKSADVGFRRKNLAPLLAKYFLDMREVFGAVHRLLKPGRSAYVVVGSNRTIAGGQKIEIPTPHILSVLAEQVGFEVRERIAMEMLVSRDIFRQNAIPGEQILELTAKSMRNTPSA